METECRGGLGAIGRSLSVSSRGDRLAPGSGWAAGAADSEPEVSAASI